MEVKEQKKEFFFLLADSEDIITPSYYLRIKFPIGEDTRKLLLEIIETVESSPKISVESLQIEAEKGKLKEIESSLFKLALLSIDVDEKNTSYRFKLISSFGIVDNTIYLILNRNFRKYIHLLRQIEKEIQ